MLVIPKLFEFAKTQTTFILNFKRATSPKVVLFYFLTFILSWKILVYNIFFVFFYSKTNYSEKHQKILTFCILFCTIIIHFIFINYYWRFLYMKKLLKKLISLTLSLTMLFSTTTVFANSAQSFSIQNEIVNALSETQTIKSAGLAWGPVTVGNIKLYMTNPHMGYVPGFTGQVSHINFHVDNAKTKKPIINYHIVKYKNGKRECIYVYDSVSDKVIINKCFNGWTDAAAAIVEAVKSAVQAVLSEADWIATLAIWAVVIVVIADLIIPMDPVPVIPFSIN